MNDDNQIKVYLSSHSPFESEREGVIITRLLGNFLSISELFCLSEMICLHFLWFPLSTLQHTYICYVKLANGFTWDFVARFHEYIDIRNYPDNNQPYVELSVIVGDVCNTLMLDCCHLCNIGQTIMHQQSFCFGWPTWNKIGVRLCFTQIFFVYIYAYTKVKYYAFFYNNALSDYRVYLRMMHCDKYLLLSLKARFKALWWIWIQITLNIRNTDITLYRDRCHTVGFLLDFEDVQQTCQIMWTHIHACIWNWYSSLSSNCGIREGTVNSDFVTCDFKIQSWIS